MNVTVFTQKIPQQASLLDQIFKLRHATFIDRLAWDIPSQNGREIDNYDSAFTHYIAVKSLQSNEVKGCWRALPTTGRYMLKDTFPELLQGEAAPVHERIWEISRFSVDKNCARHGAGGFGDVTLDLVRSFYDFACANDIQSYVTVTTVACERLLKRLGVPVRRLGAAKALQVGKERSVALQIMIDEPPLALAS